MNDDGKLRFRVSWPEGHGFVEIDAAEARMLRSFDELSARVAYAAESFAWSDEWHVDKNALTVAWAKIHEGRVRV